MIKFYENRLVVVLLLSGSRLEQIDVSYNHLGCVGVELLLKCLNHSRVTSLDLSATLTESRSSAQVYRHLYNYAVQVHRQIHQAFYRYSILQVFHFCQKKSGKQIKKLLQLNMQTSILSFKMCPVSFYNMKKFL